MHYLEYLIRKQYPSLNNFVDVTGLNRRTLWSYLNNSGFPSTDNFMMLANRLNVSAETLYKNWFREVDK